MEIFQACLNFLLDNQFSNNFLQKLSPAVRACSNLTTLFLNLNKITVFDPDFAIAVAEHPSLSFVA